MEDTIFEAARAGWIAEMKQRPWVCCVDSDCSGTEVALSGGWVFAGSRAPVATWDRVWDALIGSQYINVRYVGDEHLRGYTAVAKVLIGDVVYSGQATFNDTRPCVYYVGATDLVIGRCARADHLMLREALGQWVLRASDGDDSTEQLQHQIERYATRLLHWAADGRKHAVVDVWQYAEDDRLCFYAADEAYHDSGLFRYVRDSWARSCFGSLKSAFGAPRVCCRLAIDRRFCSVTWGNRWGFEWSV